MIKCFFKDDFRCNLRYGIIEKDMEPVCPLDMSGRFTEEVTHFKGMHVKVDTTSLNFNPSCAAGRCVSAIRPPRFEIQTDVVQVFMAEHFFDTGSRQVYHEVVEGERSTGAPRTLQTQLPILLEVIISFSFATYGQQRRNADVEWNLCCFRSDTPLIYRAVPSWFVRVESFKDSLLQNNG